MTVTMDRGRHWHELDGDEQAAVRRLARALRDWPRSLGLFGWSGSLCVKLLDLEENTRGAVAVVATFNGVHGDGGDPPGCYDGPVTRPGRRCE